MSYLTDDLSMASVNMAKVVNLEEVISEAEKALENNRLSEENRHLITDTLDKIKNTEDYEITPEMVEEIDGIISEVSLVTVNEEGKSELYVVQGTESFGYTLTPKAWKADRIAGCESLIDELSKNVKRWANQLNSKLNELLINNRYNIDSLKERLVKLDQRMAEVSNIHDEVEFVTIPAIINKTLSVKNRSIVTNEKIDAILKNEVNFIFTVIKMWDLEVVDFKNRFIRYFGTKATSPLKLLDRQHPKFFSKKSAVDTNDNKLIYWVPVQGKFIGEGGVWFCENNNTYDNLPELAANLDDVGYSIVQSMDNKDESYEDVKIVPLSLPQLDKIYDVISKIISIIEGLNQKDNDFDLNERDVKDVLATVKLLDDPIIMDAYAGISTHYQIDVTAAQTGFIKYLHNLCSHLITFIFINLDGYV